MSRLKALSRASLTVIELQSPVEDFSTPTARITENWEKLLADRAHPQRPRTLRSASHLHGLASPVEDGPSVFSPSRRCTSALAGGETRHVQPIALRDGITDGLRTYYKEEDDLNPEDLVVQTSSTQSKYAVHGVVEHLLAYAVPGGLLDLP